MKKNSYGKILKDGVITQNPVLVQVLGMCPTLAVSTRLMNGLGMGVAVTVVLIFSNLFISLLRKVIDKRIRIASFIVIIAGFVTMVEMVMKAYLPSLSESLGVYIPLIVVNCIILARAEAFASRNKPLPSVVDGIASGVGFTAAICIVSTIREVLGTGALLGYDFKTIPPIMIFTLAPGGLLVLGFVMAFCAWVGARRKARAARLASAEADGGEGAPAEEKPAKKAEKKEEPKPEASSLKPTIAESVLQAGTAKEPAPEAAPEPEPAPAPEPAPVIPSEAAKAAEPKDLLPAAETAEKEGDSPSATPPRNDAPEPAPEPAPEAAPASAEQLTFAAVEEAPAAEEAAEAFAGEPSEEEKAARRRAYLEEKEAARGKKERKPLFRRKRREEAEEGSGGASAPDGSGERADEDPLEPPAFMSEAIVDLDKRRSTDKEAGENG